LSQQINLYNPLFLTKEKYFSARTMLQGLGLIAAGVAALYAYALVQTLSAERLAASHRQQLEMQRQQFVELGKFSAQSPNRALEAEVARLGTEVQIREATLDALSTGELGNTSGFSEFLAALGRRAVPGVWLTGITIADSGNNLVITGRVLRADLMPSYLRALNDEAVMRGRRVTELKLAAREASATGSKDRVQGPERFVEFKLTAPLRLAEAAGDASAEPPRAQ